MLMLEVLGKCILLEGYFDTMAGRLLLTLGVHRSGWELRQR